MVSNVTASQRTDGSGIVDIYYTLNDADGDDCTIGIQVSADGGVSWNVAATDLDGDIGAGINPGRHHILWHSKTDLTGEYGTNYRVKITTDGDSTHSDMVSIPSGTFQMGDSFGEGISKEFSVHTVTLDSFYMSQYEITNQQYCDYLNLAYPAQIKVTGGVVYADSDSSNSYPYCSTHSYNNTSQIDFSGGVVDL